METSEFDLELYASLLGQTVGNLMSLETALRMFLYAEHDPPHIGLDPSVDIASFVVDQLLPVNALTDYSTMRQLVVRYNSIVANRNANLTIPENIVSVRDAIAHGRTLTASPMEPLRLFKFSKPQNGKVKVEVSIVLSEKTMRRRMSQVSDALQKVSQAHETYHAAP